MAATGKTPILLYGSTTATNTPVAGNLTNSVDGCEIAINVADKNLFFKDTTNTVNTVPISQSSTSSNGWLSSTDWNTFNNKASTSSPTFTGNVTLSTGNLVIGTSDKGIDFSATAGTGTSELLADYEEGTWTPVDGSGAGLSFTGASGVYTKVGRQVTVFFTLVYPVTANASAARIGGLPFTAANSNNGFNSGAFNINNSGQVIQPSIVANNVVFAALLTATGTSATNAQLTGASLRGGFSYFV